MIECPEVVPRSESMSKVDEPKRNVMPSHVPSVKVQHMEHHDGEHFKIPITREGQARLKEYPPQRIRDRTTEEARDIPKIVGVSTAFNRRQDIQMSVKSEDMKMKISGKGDDVSFKNTLTELWTG